MQSKRKRDGQKNEIDLFNRTKETEEQLQKTTTQELIIQVKGGKDQRKGALN